MMILLPSIVTMNIFALSVAIELAPVVNLVTGPVQGQILKTVKSVKYEFYGGIPYAKPPIGDLRFKPPIAPDPWIEVLNTTVEGNECVQFNPLTKLINGSEDCLFINVYKPMVKKRSSPPLKAVIFWIYGGAFLLGPPSISFGLRPDNFIDEDIVFVSLNYRPGIFGYLALGLPNVTGNMGLKDLVLGLKWVRQNIEKFDGDPNRVTLLGASTGAAAVQYMLLSEATEGLYHGAITMSGTPLSPWAFQTPADALAAARKLGKIMGINATDPEGLYEGFSKASAEDIVFATSKIDINFGPFTPTIEDPEIATDVLLDSCSIDKYTSGKFAKVPQILGYCDQETVVFVSDYDKISELTDTAENAAKALHITLPSSITAVANSLNSSSNYSDKNYNYTELRKYINDSSDFLYIGPLDHTRRFVAAHNDGYPVYYYHLSYYVPGPHSIAPDNTLPGAGHGDDLPFIFYMATRNFSNNPTAMLTSERMTAMWSNFVKFGNPTPYGMDDDILKITWPETGPFGVSMRIGSELTIDVDPLPKNAKQFELISKPFFREANGCY